MLPPDKGGHNGRTREMAVEGIRQRFAHLVTDAESVGGRVKDILAKAAEEIGDLFGSDSHPAQNKIIQHLEQAAHTATTSPALAVPVEQAADPTPAGQTEPAPEAASTPEAADSPPETTSTEPSGPSEGTSHS
jgi:hypothetical protein